MTKSKYKFFQQIRMAVTKPMQYFRITNISNGRLIGFVFLFVLLTSLLFMLPICIKVAGPHGITTYLKDNIPAFQFSEGELHMDNRIEENDGMSFILVDTNVQRYDQDDINELYDQVILVSKTNMITYQNGMIQEFDFKELGNLKFDNGILNLLTPIIFLCLVLVLIFYYLFLVAAYYLTALLYSLVGLIVSYATNMTVRFSTLYRTAIYAKVTSTILFSVYFLVMLLTPIYIPWLIVFGIIILIDCTYVVYGTMSHTSSIQDNNQPPENPYTGQSF